jgi:hypothetical protein
MEMAVDKSSVRCFAAIPGMVEKIVDLFEDLIFMIYVGKN